MLAPGGGVEHLVETFGGHVAVPWMVMTTACGWTRLTPVATAGARPWRTWMQSRSDHRGDAGVAPVADGGDDALLDGQLGDHLEQDAPGHRVTTARTEVVVLGQL